MTDDKLRELVAVHVFGWTDVHSVEIHSAAMVGIPAAGGDHDFIPDYLTWAGLGLIVEEMERKGFYLRLVKNVSWSTTPRDKWEWYAGLAPERCKPGENNSVWDLSPSRAVSLAALKAVGVEVED